jgi:hypothetical protein
VIGYALFPLAAFAGFAALCASMLRHCTQVFGRKIAPRTALTLRIAAVALLAIAWMACVRCWGVAMGSMAWICILPVAAIAVVACLTWSPRNWLRVGGMGATAISLLLLLVMIVR